MFLLRAYHVVFLEVKRTTRYQRHLETGNVKKTLSLLDRKFTRIIQFLLEAILGSLKANCTNITSSKRMIPLPELCLSFINRVNGIHIAVFNFN